MEIIVRPRSLETSADTRCQRISNPQLTGWIDAWMNEWMDAWMNAWMDEWMDV